VNQTPALAMRRLRTSVEVTEIGFGTAPIGGFRAHVPEADAQGAMDALWRAGGRYWDTSPYYGYGRSELRIGGFLRSAERPGIVLSTKIGRWMRRIQPGDDRSTLRPNGLEFWPVFDYSYDGAMRSLEQSFLRLGVPRIDIALIHDVDVWTHGSQDAAQRMFDTAMNGAYRALDELRRAGDIRAIGAGINEAAWCRKFIETGDFDCMMLAGRYTLIDHAPEVRDLFALCRARNVGILLAGVFNSGILATGSRADATFDYKPASAEVQARVQRVEAVCRRHNASLSAAAIQFALAEPVIKSAVLGAVRAAEVEANIAAYRAPIPPGFWAELKDSGLLARELPVPGGSA
jgi:D-threo-aldose 1-dehydrogenase